MKDLRFRMMTALLAALVVTGCGVSYMWSESIKMPEHEEQKIADCVMAKINISDLKSKSMRMFPNVPKDWIAGIEIKKMDATKIYDYGGKGIEIWIRMPSSKEAYTSPSPVVEYLKSVTQEQLNACVSENK